MWWKKMWTFPFRLRPSSQQFAGNSDGEIIAVRLKAILSVGRHFGVGENGTNGEPALLYLLLSFA